MGVGFLPGDGSAANRVAWLVLGDPATRLCLGVFAGGPGLLRHLQCLRSELAGLVRRWGPSRSAGLPDSDARARVGGLGTPESRTRSQWDQLLAKCVGCGKAPSVALRLCDHPDDGLQFAVAWHPGQLPHLPANAGPRWVQS